MSASLTTEAVLAEEKDVTRRLGWAFLKPGDLVWMVEKAMGLKKGEHVNRLKLVRIVSTRWEPLDAITPEDVAREGFYGWTPLQFVGFFMATHRKRHVQADTLVNRIEFSYVH